MQQRKCLSNTLGGWVCGFPTAPKVPLMQVAVSLLLPHTGHSCLTLNHPCWVPKLCFLGLPCLYHCKYSVYFDNQNSKARVAWTLCGFRKHYCSGMWEVNKTKQTKTKCWQPREFRVKVHFANMSAERLWSLKTQSSFSYFPSVCFYPVKKLCLSCLLPEDYWKCATEHTVILASFNVYVQ